MWPGSSSLQLLNCYVCHMLRRRRRRSWSIMTTGIRDSRQSQNAFSGEREAIYFNSWGNFATRQVGGWGSEQDNHRILSSPEGCETIASIHKLPLLRAPRCPWESGVRRESRVKACTWLGKEAPGGTIQFPWGTGKLRQTDSCCCSKPAQGIAPGINHLGSYFLSHWHVSLMWRKKNTQKSKTDMEIG